jgi:extracellular elastinolytic metalloproteinase
VHPRRFIAGTAIAASTALALSLTSLSSEAAPARRTGPGDPGVAIGRTTPKDLQNFDSRRAGAAGRILLRRQQHLAVDPPQAVTSLRQSLGVQGVVSVDPLTGTPRAVARLDGFLTGPSTRRPEAIVTDYVSSHRGVFGLGSADLGTLRLRKSYTDISGTRHLSWLQYAGTVPVFGDGLKANVAKDGRLISVTGSPVRGLTAVAATPALTAPAARRTALRDLGEPVTAVTADRAAGPTRPTTFSDDDRASLVAFPGAAGARLAWQTLVTPRGGAMFLHVIDAGSGKVLYRQNLTASDTGNVWEYWPGKSVGGRSKVVDLTRPGWLPQGSPRLAGNNAHVWSDVNDDDAAQSSEEVRPGSTSFRFPFVDFTATNGRPCTQSFRCSWNPATPLSWQRNRKQNAVQVFYYVNKYHDHLRATPIGFTRAAGNFEAVDDDAVQTQPDDGADTGTGPFTGLPDSSHVDNANMGTPPDGIAPRMQMFLFHDPADDTDPFLPTNGGDEADVVYHEYTHGLSNRLVVDPAGVGALNAPQSGAMGEAWSDWYAMDFLVNQGFQTDTSAPGEVRIGQYVGHGKDLIRTQPIDCPVGSTSSRCHGTTGAGRGGYTYGDFGRIIGSPEVHADGEIWSETLWDLRRALGSRLSESLVTRAMELSPPEPSYLDMRNSIVQADTVTNGGRARATIWRVFAHRGMGYFAGAIDGEDTSPVEDFSLPPSPSTPKGSLTGRVIDGESGAPVAGAIVAFGGHTSGFPTDYAATAGSDGRYSISGIFAGTYPKVFAQGPGHDRTVRTVSIGARENKVDWGLRRDWAALSGGASVTDTNGDEFAEDGCGAAAAFDLSQSQGWSTLREISGGQVVAKFVVVRLPATVDVSEVAIDPTGTCGDAGSASTGPFSLETSTDGTTWRPAASGTFTPADRGHFSSPSLAPGSTTAVRFLRYTMKDSQVPQVGSCPGPFDGCDFIDTSEIEVYGSPTR